MSYHAASGIIAIGLHIQTRNDNYGYNNFTYKGQVELWQTAPQFAPVPQGALPTHACVRARLAEAQAQAAEIEVPLSKADVGLRQLMSREQELKRSIADLEAKCAYICAYIHILTLSSGE